MVVIGCASAFTAHAVLTNCEQTKATQLEKFNWQQNSEDLNKLCDRTLKTNP